MGRAKKEDQISVRLDPKLRASLEEIKEEYGYLTDSDAIRGLIQLVHNKDIIASEVEGRVLRTIIPIIEARLNEYHSSDDFKRRIWETIDEGFEREDEL